ncbi:MAG: beta-galactosidase [Planctomycetes bacterium]|nr:beta-galactosidase [Planctomycetota bacterium]
MLVKWAAALSAATCLPSIGAPAAPMRHGVVFFCPESEAEAVRQLERIQGDGFDSIEFASWIWTLPTPGSAFERRVRAVLDWCDENDMGFFLMHNIQYEGEGGGLDAGVIRPEGSFRLLTDWARILKGHDSVLGVILGNEVGPNLGTPKEAPRLWQDFRAWLKARHGTIEALNSAWGTTSETFDAVGAPPKGSGGDVDVRRYARLRFARYYAAYIDGVLRPALGEKLYGQKTWLDPFLHRDCEANTMICWDDLVAQYPLWSIKCAADTTGKPLFNAEIHLYHDGYAYGPSVEQTRYRYFTSALLGEYLTASFAWGSWNKPDIAKIHAQTSIALSDMRKVERACRAIASAYRRSDLAVLVTEANFYRDIHDVDRIQANPLPILYARMGALGRPWRYLLEDDVKMLRSGLLIVWTARVRPSVIEAILALPESVEVIAVNALPREDEYGRRLPEDLAAALRKRARTVPLADLAATVGPQPGLPEAYRKPAEASYLSWSPRRGHFGYAVPYCALEARRAESEDGLVVAVINNTPQARTAPIPWAEGRTVVDLIASRPVSARDSREASFGPLEVGLFLLKK